MSAQLYNPESNKIVNVDPKQIKTLKAAGWTNVDSKALEAIAEAQTGAEVEVEVETKAKKQAKK